MSENKTKPTSTKLSDFLSTIENSGIKKDSKTIIKIMREISGHKPIIWGNSIIGFGNTTLKYESGRKTDLPVICFAPRKHELVLYVLNNFKNQKDLLTNLGKHRTGKVCLYIKKLSDINFKILERIISNSYSKALKADTTKILQN